ncbi:hypothetical protein Sa4125_20720 [Aureimonas sp. SA4125]|uniref:hypothetical protein n=1 Tax=Aureimonas sp. SA4125 TaxID=2826993 RepID=UPI001CC35498|nr:hypothetical protein [Aureimonas sp. SA4125]BDA84530.1 hypothetical protein Sa4125_20720 [Aureimonas sp. SA4125]
MSRLLSTTSLLVAVAALSLCAGAALALDRTVTVTNNSSTPMIEFYASNTGTSEWEEDILGVDVLEVGQAFDVTIDDGSGYCKFDFKATFSDGASAVKQGVNVCEISDFSFTD